jgi:hypothetical protein
MRRLRTHTRGLMVYVTRDRVEAEKHAPYLGTYWGRVEPVAQPATSTNVRR